jgi:hypothetical protein
MNLCPFALVVVKFQFDCRSVDQHDTLKYCPLDESVAAMARTAPGMCGTSSVMVWAECVASSLTSTSAYQIAEQNKPFRLPSVMVNMSLL